MSAFHFYSFTISIFVLILFCLFTLSVAVTGVRFPGTLLPEGVKLKTLCHEKT